MFHSDFLATHYFSQVAEVLTSEKERLSISGWFHGPPIDRPPHYIEPALPDVIPIPTKDAFSFTASSSVSEDEIAAKLMAEWLNPIYLDPKNIADIAAEFEEEQSIELHNFLNMEKFVQLVETLHDQPWEIYGPANKRHYQLLPDGQEVCVNVLSSMVKTLILLLIVELNCA